MTIKSRTIDNLGIDSSVRYAKDQEQLDTRLIEESRFIPQKTEVSVVKPYVSSDFEQLFESGKTAAWAIISPPPGYASSGKPLFSYQLIPSLGGSEKLEADSDKIEALEESLKKPFTRKQTKEDDEREHQKEEEERKILLALFKCIKQLDRTLTLINSRRNQYQRG